MCGKSTFVKLKNDSGAGIVGEVRAWTKERDRAGLSGETVDSIAEVTEI